MSMRKLIFLLMGGQLACFLALASYQIVSSNKMQAMSARVMVDSKAIEAALRLESSVLGERREDLLWRETEDEKYYLLKKNFLENSDLLIKKLHETSTSAEEDELIGRIQELYTLYYQQASALPVTSLARISQTTDSLLLLIQEYWQLNQDQTVAALLLSDRLNRTVDRWAMVLIVVVSCITLLGARQLLKRILLPISSLSRTAESFGKGATDCKATVYRDDELGMLSRTINRMIENIAALQQERSLFVACLTHDLKNPLMLIGATARRLRKKGALSDSQIPLVERIVEQTQALEELIGELMEVMRMEDGRSALDVQEIDLSELVRTAMEKEAALITSHKFAFDGDARCMVRGDTTLLQRVVANLISNAVKYSFRDTLIATGVRRRGNRVILFVKDEGVGIPEDKVSSLCKPFSRLAHTKQMATGTGLGLYSVKKIVEAHQGSIAIESVPNRGTKVTIELPEADRNGSKFEGNPTGMPSKTYSTPA